jgi:hypothetical protein
MKIGIEDILFAIFFTLVLTLTLTKCCNDNTWEKDAIRAGAAHYEKSTGNFKWNGDEK